jgi:hypothetical protein
MNIRDSTLSTWKKNLKINQSCRPSHAAYRTFWQIFTDEQESELIHWIRTGFLDREL